MDWNKSISLQEAINLICVGNITPTIVCNKELVLGCNQEAINALKVPNGESLVNRSYITLIQDHFTPAVYNKPPNSPRPSLPTELCYARLPRFDDSYYLAPVRIKKWFFESQEFYTLTFANHDLLSLFQTTSHESSLNAQPSPTIEVPSFDDHNLIPIDPKVCDGNHGTNVSMEKRYQQRLLEEFTNLANLVPIMLWATDPQGNNYYVNNLYKEKIGVDYNESWEDCVYPGDVSEYMSNWRIARENEITFESQEIRIRKNPARMSPDVPNPYRYHLVRAEPIKDPQTGKITQWIGFCTDIQDLKDAEMERKRLMISEQTALQSSKMKSRFLAVMSHEIRTPLFGIIGNTCLLTDSKLDDDQREQLENINYSAQLLLRIVGDILDFSKIESGKLEVHDEPFAIHNVFKRMENMFKAEAQQKGVSLIFPYFSNTTYQLMGDPNRILQVLTNLVSNSIKFTPEGGSIRVSCEYEIFNNPPRYHFKVSVEDTGIGIPSDTVPLLFSPWTQAKNNNQHAHGSGLGLSISKSLVELMGGRVGLSSQLGVGTICWFELELPLINYSASPTSSSPKEQYSRNYQVMEDTPQDDLNNESHPINPPSPRKQFKCSHPPVLRVPVATSDALDSSLPCLRTDHEHRVLIAEDNPINQKILKKYLGKMRNINITMVQNGLEALNVYHQHPTNHFCLILLDHLMPLMNGDLVCKLIRENNSRLPIISVSASTMNNELENFKRVGMSDHLAKPFTSKQLDVMINKWLK